MALFASLAIVALLAMVWSRAGPEAGVYIPAASESAPGELIVQFREGADHERVAAALAAAGAAVERELTVDGFALVNVPEGAEDVIGQVLAEMGGLATVERNEYKSLAWAPNDPFYQVDGMNTFEQWNLQVIQVEQAWDEFPLDGGGKPLAGAGARVAVVDTGIAFEAWVDPGTIYLRPQDMAGLSFADPYDYFDDVDPDNPNDSVHPNDTDGHGTHIAGTIAAATNNAHVSAGVAYAATILPVRVCELMPAPEEPLGVKSVCPNAAIAEGIDWAVDHGAGVINMSFEGESLSQAEEAAIERAADAGSVMVAATGNADQGESALGIKWPAAHADVMAVGAVGRPPSDTDPSKALRAGYSRYGPDLDLVAPGGANRSPGDPPEDAPIWQETYEHLCPPNNNPNLSYTDFFICGFYGTSSAAAHVSGVAALIRSQYPSANKTQVEDLLTRCALDLSQPGKDLQHGNGLVQAWNSIKDANGDGTADGLQDIDSDNIWDCEDPDVVGPSPTPTAPPTPTPPPNECMDETPTPTASVTPTLTPTPTATPTETPPTPAETPPPTPPDAVTPAPEPTATPTPTGGGAGGASAPTPTPTPTPTPVNIACGDTDCDLDVDAVDALNVLKFVAVVPPIPFCIGFGYTDCNGKLEATDALMILKDVAALPYELPPGCSQIGYLQGAG